MQILLEKKAVEIVRDTTSPGFYSRIFFVKKKTGRFPSHYRPIIAQQNDEGRSLSNGNCGLHSESYSSRGVGGFYRLYGCIPPYSYSSSVSQVPEIFPRRHYIPISGASIRNPNSAFRFYKLEIVAGHIRSLGPNIHQYFDDWLVHPLWQESLLSNLSLAWEIITSLVLIPNPLKSNLVPSQDFVYVGMRILTHIGIVRVPEERVNKILVLLFQVLQVQFITAREFLSMLGSLNAAADLVQLGCLHMRPLQFHLLANWKPHRDSLVQPIPISHSCRVAIKWWMNPSIYVNSPCYTSPRFPSVFRCQPFGLGRTFRTPRSRGSGTVGCCFPRPSHQQFGVTSSFPSTPTFSESHLQFLRDGSVRQFISSGLPQEARGDRLSISVHASMGASLLVSSSEYSHSSQAYSRETECFGRQPVSPRPNSPHRMVSRSGDSSPNFQSLGYSSDRSFRHQIKPSSAPVCFSSTGPQGLCSGCYVTRMEKPIRIRISSIQTCSPGSKQDKGFQQSVHSHSSMLASEELVFSHFESHNRLSQGTSCSSGFGITTSGKSTPSESSYVASSRLEVVRSQIRGRHISEFATQCISQSRRESTLKVYSARWKIFSDWCLQREVNPVYPALNDLVDFFCYLFDTLKLSVASIKGYRSAISNTLNFPNQQTVRRTQSFQILLKVLP